MFTHMTGDTPEHADLVSSGESSVAHLMAYSYIYG